MDLVTLLGVLAGIITTASLLPQAISCFRHKSTRDLSMSMLILSNVGLVLWIVYGIFVQSLPLLMADSVSLVINSGLIYMKTRYDGKN